LAGFLLKLTTFVGTKPQKFRLASRSALYVFKTKIDSRHTREKLPPLRSPRSLR
jgi:hypothetical protein